MNWKQKFFFYAPMWIKESVVAYEARKRNKFRRYGNYSKVLHEYGFDRFKTFSLDDARVYQLSRVNSLIQHIRSCNNFYNSRIIQEGNLSWAQFQEIPVLTKREIIGKIDMLCSRGYSANDIFWGLTSGSTGTPLKFGISREGVRIRFALYDNYCNYNEAPYGLKRARFSGTQVAPIEKEKPPFWVYNRVFNQLQMSAYHITPRTARYYIEKLQKFKPVALTGYPHAMAIIADFMLDNKITIEGIKTIFTDSECLLPEHRVLIEKAFNTHCRDLYGCGEITGGAYECSKRQYVEMFMTCIIEVLDENDRPVKPGEIGRIIMTDLTNYDCPFIRYDTGDLGVPAEKCECEWGHLFHLKEVIGRVDDMVLTPNGRWIGRLSHVLKPGIGIKMSQIIQRRINHIDILVVPAGGFDPGSMKNVIAKAKEYLGDDMEVVWHIVDEITPNPKSHKLKHVVRDPSIGSPTIGQGIFLK